MKTQTIRLLDVFLIGPVMIAGGLKIKSILGNTLTIFGILTIFYNARNYMEMSNGKIYSSEI